MNILGCPVVIQMSLWPDRNNQNNVLFPVAMVNIDTGNKMCVNCDLNSSQEGGEWRVSETNSPCAGNSLSTRGEGLYLEV